MLHHYFKNTFIATLFYCITNISAQFNYQFDFKYINNLGFLTDTITYYDKSINLYNALQVFLVDKYHNGIKPVKKVDSSYYMIDYVNLSNQYTLWFTVKCNRSIKDSLKIAISNFELQDPSEYNVTSPEKKELEIVYEKYKGMSKRGTRQAYEYLFGETELETKKYIHKLIEYLNN